MTVRRSAGLPNSTHCHSGPIIRSSSASSAASPRRRMRSVPSGVGRTAVPRDDAPRSTTNSAIRARETVIRNPTLSPHIWGRFWAAATAQRVKNTAPSWGSISGEHLMPGNIHRPNVSGGSVKRLIAIFNSGNSVHSEIRQYFRDFLNRFGCWRPRVRNTCWAAICPHLDSWQNCPPENGTLSGMM